MKSMKEVFNGKPCGFSTRMTDEQVRRGQHAINCHDELVDALQHCLENIKGTPLALKVGKVLAKARGES